MEKTPGPTGGREKESQTKVRVGPKKSRNTNGVSESAAAIFDGGFIQETLTVKGVVKKERGDHQPHNPVGKSTSRVMPHVPHLVRGDLKKGDAADRVRSR